MDEKEFRKLVSRIIAEEENPENLKRNYSEAKKAFKKGDSLGLDYMADFASSIASEHIYKKEIKPAIKILEDVREAIDESRNNEAMLFWPQALFSIYPLLAFCYTELNNWDKSKIIIEQYIANLDNLFDADGIPYPSNEDEVIEKLYQILELQCTHYRYLGKDQDAINYMQAASRIISFGEEKTQLKYYAFLTKCYHSIGDAKKVRESYGEFLENYNCVASTEVTVPDPLREIYDDLANIIKYKSAEK